MGRSVVKSEGECTGKTGVLRVTPMGLVRLYSHGVSRLFTRLHHPSQSGLATRCLRPLGHLSTDLSSMRGSQSSATQVDDRRKTSKRAVILLQATWEVQANCEEDQEKLSEKTAKTHRSNCLVHRGTIGFFTSWTSADERLRAHCSVCFMLSVVSWSHDRKGIGWVCGYPIAVGCAREVVMLAIGAA